MFQRKGERGSKMKNFKIFVLIILVISFNALVIFGQKKIVHPIKPKDFDGLGLSKDIKTLVKGAHSKVETPFVFVARDEKTYAQLQNLVEGLPDVSTIDFSTNAVIAGFAGEKSTGGWTVEIKKTAKGYGLIVQVPGKGMMVTQEITNPFNVAQVPIDSNKSLALDLPINFNSKIQNFRVNKGDFEYTGGIAGRRKQFKADGTIRLLTSGDYVSVWFDLKGKGADQTRKLSAIASGTFKNGNLEIERLDAGNFVEMPHPPFLVKGMLKDKTLSLNFEPLPTNVADGYEGRGSLEAVRIK